MKGKIARALRKAVKYKPANDRTYTTINTVKEIFMEGMAEPFKLNRVTVINEIDTPRQMYQAAKKLLYAGQVNNIDTSR